ncbi:MAG: LysR family transcriptional regulator [Gracilibacteraceae bacterium]|nr:LysR family transcriptional regulator [Gracilibacteraceae bacterium]
MNSQQIKYFLSVAKYRNFTKAAEHSFVSQPAITKQISLLEREIGLLLFQRDKRSVVLTPAGEIMQQALLEIQNLYERAVQEAREIDRGLTGRLRVGYINGLLLETIPLVLNDFSQTYPQVEVSFECLSFSALKKGLAEDSIDLGITLLLDVYNRPDLQWELICAVPDGFVFSRDSWFTRQKDLTVADFREAVFYIISPGECNVDELFHKICQLHGFLPKNVRYVADPGSMLLMAESNQGVTFLDRLTYDNIANRDKLCFFELDVVIDILAVWKKNNLNPLRQVFITALRRFL